MVYTPRKNQKNKARHLGNGTRVISIATTFALVAFITATTTAVAHGTKPQLKILHVNCIDNLIGVRFGLVNAPQAQNYGVVQYTMTAPGNLIIVASAAFAEKTGNNAYYTDTVSGNNGVYTITAAHVTVNSTTHELENAGEQFNITNCHSQTSPSPTPSPSPSHSPTPSPTPTPSHSPSPTPEQISCPLQQQANRTLINFNVNSFLRSDQGLSQATGEPFPVSLAPGTYTVTVTSYDKHSSKPQQLQLNERWRLTLQNSAGSTIATTNATSDLPENVDAYTEIINNNLNITGAIASVTTQHAAYPDTSSPNSITPVCAAFDRTTTTQPSPTPSPSPSPTPTPTPETQSASVGIAVTKTDHRETIKVGQTLTYTIEVENTGEDDFTNVTIKDTVPSALTITNISAGGILEGHTITWQDIGLAAGEKITVTVTATVKADTDAGHTLVNTVTARSEDKGPSATDTDTTVVEKQPRVAAAITQDPAPVPITATTGANLGTALAALTSALSFTILALKRWWT